jgi:hypothetical protein
MADKKQSAPKNTPPQPAAPSRPSPTREERKADLDVHIKLPMPDVTKRA